MKVTLIILTFLLISLKSRAQDTIRIEPSIRFTSAEYPNRSKGFAINAKYAREDIVYSTTKKKIEYCYYYDSLRICHGDTYEIISDSILKTDNRTWIFKKQNDKFIIFSRDSGNYE